MRNYHYIFRFHQWILGRCLVRAGTITLFGTAILAGSLVMMPAASAETITFKSELKAANEAPPNDSTGTGSVEATFDTVTKILSWTITYSGLSGPVIGAHLHGPAEA